MLPTPCPRCLRGDQRVLESETIGEPRIRFGGGLTIQRAVHDDESSLKRGHEAVFIHDELG